MIASSFCNADSMFSREEGIDVRKMMGHKRSPCSVDQSSYTIASKRQKSDMSITTKAILSTTKKSQTDGPSVSVNAVNSLTDGTSASVRAMVFGYSLADGPSVLERKDKLGERIVALQQLVSPYGKTDTSSVLKEAMEYIGFLHQQVKVLSAPYLESSPKTEIQGIEPCSLRSRGLCLVPASLTMGVADSNGADIWAPIKTTSPKFEKDDGSQF